MSLKKLLPSIKDPEIKKRVQAIIDDGKQLGSIILCTIRKLKNIN